tara:strand:+ start:449 stop:703 length:255 start_codon:yes stop_codon:yes gene_type:complete
MNLYINQIEEKIKNKIKLETIKIIDNSEAHKSHKSFQKGKLHLILEIKSNYLNKLKRVEAEKILMGIIKDEFKQNIHALEIRLK